MINSTSNNEYSFHTSSDASSRVEKTDDLHNYCDQEQGRSCKKPRKLKFDINLPNKHFCKPVKQILKGELKFWLTCDPNIRECNGGLEIYGMDEEGVIKKWFEKWCNNNPNTPTLRFTTVQENLNPRPKDYPFKDWLLTKWHDQKSEEEERRQLGINIEEYDPPIVHVETFKIKRYSFDTGQNFICVTKELMDALPLGRENESRFRDMIRKEVYSGRRIYRKT
ncbi:hypothetical protein Tco_0810396 [Tanacetum coccineum]